MGKYDSSKYRVQPVFDALRDRDPTGRTWLAKLLGLPTRPDRRSPALDPDALGTITRGALNSARPAPGAASPDGWTVKEASLPAPRRLLLHLVEHMQDPTSQKAWGTGEVETKRRSLRAGHADTRREASEYLTGARTSPPRRSRWEILEGPTRPDVYLETPSAIIVIEGKFTESAPTTKTTWMSTRSQMLRHIDAAWDRREGRAVYGFFIVESAIAPGWARACEETVAPEMVTGSLPHRNAAEQVAVVDAFLGITTWAEVCAALGLDVSLLQSQEHIDARVKSAAGARLTASAPSATPRNGVDDVFPTCTTEEHPARYDYRSRFPNARVVGLAEGGSVLAADDATGAYVITDEGTLADFLSDEDAQSMSFISICRFESAADRDRYCELRYGPLMRAMEQQRKLW